MLKRFDYPREGEALTRRWRRTPTADLDLDRDVWKIIDAVRRRGDWAVARLTRRFDHVALSPDQFRVEPARLKAAWRSLPSDLRATLQLARDRVERFHRKQLTKGYRINDRLGVTLEQRVQPLASVGLYVPGGKAAYPSTAIMTATPAFVAGVERVVMVTPPHEEDDLANRATWGAAWIAGVREAYTVGGAQAVAALAFGTETIPRVDKVVGPGNRYVAAAKKQLYGQIDIDSVAGPSEVLILADTTARADLIAVDLMAQAEHDEAASAILVLIGKGQRIIALADAVDAELKARTVASPRAKIARASLRKNGSLVFVESRKDAVALSDLRAPEHLEIMTRKPRELADKVRNAGAIFVGEWCPEALGDYIAGPNHTLPTGGTARFFSPLGVDDYVKRSNILEASPKAMANLGPKAALLADVEGLVAHAESLRLRF